MDTPKSRFITALEHFWNAWASTQSDILLIVCGSSSSWITKKLLKNRRGLHNRVTARIILKPFTLGEVEKYFDERGLRFERRQILDLYLVFGGIPFYLRLIKPGLSVAQNIDSLCFRENSPLKDEFEELYYSLFNNPQQHIKIVRALGQKQKGLTRQEIIEATRIPSGRALSATLNELEQCGFIRSFKNIQRAKKGMLFQLIDPFSLFALKQMKGADADESFRMSRLDHPALRAWSGYAFEMLCLSHIPQIKRALGISGVAVTAASWRSSEAVPGAQIDLVLDRRDAVINLCEMKYAGAELSIDKRFADSLTHKLDAFIQESKTTKDVHLTIVTTIGVKKGTYSPLISSVVTMNDLFL